MNRSRWWVQTIGNTLKTVAELPLEASREQGLWAYALWYGNTSHSHAHERIVAVHKILHPKKIQICWKQNCLRSSKMEWRYRPAGQQSAICVARDSPSACRFEKAPRRRRPRHPYIIKVRNCGETSVAWPEYGSFSRGTSLQRGWIKLIYYQDVLSTSTKRFCKEDLLLG